MYTQSHGRCILQTLIAIHSYMRVLISRTLVQVAYAELLTKQFTNSLQNTEQGHFKGNSYATILSINLRNMYVLVKYRK